VASFCLDVWMKIQYLACYCRFVLVLDFFCLVDCLRHMCCSGQGTLATAVTTGRWCRSFFHRVCGPGTLISTRDSVSVLHVDS
jgi:hypothetical protein